MHTSGDSVQFIQLHIFFRTVLLKKKKKTYYINSGSISSFNQFLREKTMSLVSVDVFQWFAVDFVSY